MDLYTWNTPNGQKPVLMLEELKADCIIIPVDIMVGAQNQEDFRSVNPNGKIPAMRGGDISSFESGGILLYLAELFGKFRLKNLLKG